MITRYRSLNKPFHSFPSVTLRTLLVSLAIIFFVTLRSTTAFAPAPSLLVAGQTTPLSKSPIRSWRSLYARVNGDSSLQEPLPFVIESIPLDQNERVYTEISEVCIQAFFNDGEQHRKIPPWKAWQLGYLRQLQQSDLKVRRRKYPDTNFMLVARRVYPISEMPGAVRHTPLILDVSQVLNLQPQPEEDYVRGEILGFVEVTKKPYGLGSEKVGFDDESRIKLRKMSFYESRPVLTNLSVRYEARQSGVGSKLVQACEDRVLRDWGMKEMILEVEDDNDNARNFYLKRGYKVLFEDPASRRYDTTGVWLKQVRCKRQIMRKALGAVELVALNAFEVKNSVNKLFGIKILQRLRDNVLGTIKERVR
jgi:ribosomal protein S18 acetylase RimI-like enzyme